MRNLTLKRLVWVGIITSAVVVLIGMWNYFEGQYVPDNDPEIQIVDQFFAVLQIVPAAAFAAALAVAATRRHFAPIFDPAPGRLGFARPAREFTWAIAAAVLAIAASTAVVLLYAHLVQEQQSAGFSSGDENGLLGVQDGLGLLSSVLRAAAGVFLTVALFLCVLAAEQRRAHPHGTPGQVGFSHVETLSDSAGSTPATTAIEHWWPQLTSATRGWLISNNGDSLPDDVARAVAAVGGSIHYEPSESGDGADEALLSDDDVEWIEGVATGRISW